MNKTDLNRNTIQAVPVDIFLHIIVGCILVIKGWHFVLLVLDISIESLQPPAYTYAQALTQKYMYATIFMYVGAGAQYEKTNQDLSCRPINTEAAN